MDDANYSMDNFMLGVTIVCSLLSFALTIKVGEEYGKVESIKKPSVALAAFTSALIGGGATLAMSFVAMWSQVKLNYDQVAWLSAGLLPVYFLIAYVGYWRGVNKGSSKQE